MTWHHGLAGALLLLAAAPGPSNQPAEVTLTLRLGGGQRAFHPGELIPIELEYASAVRDRFYVQDVGDRDHSDDEYRVDPDRGVSDPLLDFLAVGSSSDYGSGIGALGEKPQVSKRRLNDWFRFDEPGTYRISVLSHSVHEGNSTIPVESNTLSVEILSRDPAWESAQLATQIARIDGRRPGDDVTAACRALQVLGTEAAVDVMIRRFDLVECQSEFVRGLYAAPNRQYVVRQMASWIAAPDQSVSQSYVRTLAALSVYLEHPELRPVRAAATNGHVEISSPFGGRRELIDAAIERFRASATAARPNKDPRAHALTIASAFEATRPGPDRDALRMEFIGAFLDLPPDRQEMLLENPFLYESLASPAMIPVLRRLSDLAGSANNDAAVQLADLGLRRLWRLAPAEARPRMLERIAKPSAGDTLKTLGALPDETLPSLDQALATNLLTVGIDPADIRATLFERYATSAVESTALHVINPALLRHNCDTVAAVAAYLARVDPPAARDVIRRARSMGPTGCGKFLWLNLEPFRMSPVIEEAAIDALRGTDPQDISLAAGLLRTSGSASAREPLMAALERWHAAWNGRADAVQAGVAMTLADALTFGSAWRATAADLERVRQLCVTDGCQKQMTQRMEQAEQTNIRVSYIGDPDAGGIQLAQYYDLGLTKLEARLRQYPKHTIFTLEVRSVDDATVADVRAKIGEMAKRLDLVVR